MGDAMDRPDEEYVKPTDEPEGAIGPEDLVQPEVYRPEVETPPSEEPPEEVTYKTMEGRDKTITEVAVEVAQGKWGIGQDRRSRLTEAGYNPREVQEELRKILNQ